jgi:hypothetical protein
MVSLLLRFFGLSSLPLSSVKNGLFFPSKSFGGGMIKSSVLFDEVSSPEVSHGVFSSTLSSFLWFFSGWMIECSEKSSDMSELEPEAGGVGGADTDVGGVSDSASLFL